MQADNIPNNKTHAKIHLDAAKQELLDLLGKFEEDNLEVGDALGAIYNQIEEIDTLLEEY